MVNYYDSLLTILSKKVLSKGHPLLNIRKMSEAYIYCRGERIKAIFHINSAKEGVLVFRSSFVKFNICDRTRHPFIVPRTLCCNANEVGEKGILD